VVSKSNTQKDKLDNSFSESEFFMVYFTKFKSNLKLVFIKWWEFKWYILLFPKNYPIKPSFFSVLEKNILFPLLGVINI